MYTISTLIFLFVFLTVITTTANQNNFTVTTTKFNDESKYICNGTDMGLGYYAYPIRQEDCSIVTNLKDLYNAEEFQYPPPAEKCSEEVEGIRLMYIAERFLHAPVEVLIQCNSSISLTQRIKKFRKFIQRFPLIETQKDAAESKKHRCQDRGGHTVQPPYSTDVCELEQSVFYLKQWNTTIEDTIITDFYDQPISNVRQFYNKIDAIMVELNISRETIQDIGCDNEDMRSDLCYTQLLHVPLFDTAELIMLSRLHCCCNSSTCFKIKRSAETNMFCLTGSYFYSFKNGDITDWSNEWRTAIYPLDQLILDTACYTAINVTKNTDNIGLITITLSHSERVDSEMQVELSNFTNNARTACKIVAKNGINDTENDIYMVCRENVEKSENDTVDFTYDHSTLVLQTGKTLYDLLFGMAENNWTLSQDMSLLLYQCYFHYKPPTSGTQDYCYFFYDSVQRRALNIVEGKNFVFMEPNLHKRKIQELLEQNRTDICVSTAGCEIQNGSARSCDNNERFVLVCFCRNESRYCDLDLMEKLEEDKDWSDLEYYVPYCDVGNYNLTTPTISRRQFFCFEEFTETENARKKADEMVFPVSKVGFFDRSEHGSLVENEKLCLIQGLSAYISNRITSQCGNVENRYFYCCQATLYSTKESIPWDMRQNYTCNTGKQVNECYTIAQHQKLTNPENISSTLKERKLCEGETSNSFRLPMSMWGLGFTLQPMCYFTIPLTQTAPNARIDSYYYDRYNPKGDNRGIFSILCDQRKWTVNDQIQGYACRLISTPISAISIQRDASELSCCCAAHLVEACRKVIIDDRKKFIQGQNLVLRMNDE